jgi:hypothetical protein
MMTDEKAPATPDYDPEGGYVPLSAYRPGGYGWSTDRSTYTDKKGYVWTAEAAILNGVVVDE